MTGSTANVAGVVLAAGGSTRMGRPKALLSTPHGGTLLGLGASSLLLAGLDPVLVVLGADAARVERESGLPEDSRLRLVVNADWALGLASSIRLAVETLDACAGLDALVVALADQPIEDGDLVRRLVRRWDGCAPMVLTTHGDRIVHPMLFARPLWAELAAASGDAGGRDVVRRHLHRAALEAGPAPRDLDTPQDWDDWMCGRPGRTIGGLPMLS